MDAAAAGGAAASKVDVGRAKAGAGADRQVEFVNMQADAAGNPANHIHCVWRDMNGDFDLPIGS